MGKSQRPTQIVCQGCGASVPVSARGIVPIRCKPCASERRTQQNVAASRSRRLSQNPIQPCRMCGAELPAGSTTRFKYCATCLPIYRQQYEQQRRDRNLAKDPDFDRRRDLWKHYKMRLEDWDALMAAQGGVCGVCGSPELRGKGWHVDHDHASGEIRGILCHFCNLALGHFGDDPERCESAIAYLTQVARTGEPWRPE